MRQFFRCVCLVLLVWMVWYGVLIQSGTGLGVETINMSFLRILENFTNQALIEDVLRFFIAQLLLLTFLALIIYWASIGFEEWLKLTGWKSALAGSICPLVFLHLVNSTLYPVSVTSFPVSGFWSSVVLLAVASLSVGLVVLACMRRKVVALQVIFFLIVASVPYLGQGSTKESGAQKELNKNTPNVIVLGVDALRPLELGYFGSEREVMPFLDKLLDHAEVYTNDFTPVARTHAAWVSILSGRYPYHNGLRYNLMVDKYIDKEHLITHVLKQHGYQSVWGLDERRFNDIDKTYGFDRAVGPKIGAADFLITKFSDIPLINIFANTQVGKELFPFVYINRGNFVTYVPYQFNSELVSSLSRKKPVFLAAHLCLPHYPFVNNMMKRIEVNDGSDSENYGNYLSMLELADRQLKDLLGKLKADGYLNNAIVYVLSDHGEGFPKIDKALKSGNPYSSFKVDVAGHGTSLLTINQYHNLLAKLKFRDGVPVGKSGARDKLTSLIDVAPDIAKALSISQGYDFDGMPLDSNPKERKVFLESSYSNSAVSESRINQLRVLQQSADAYFVNASGRLRLQEKLYAGFNQAKQRAVISSSGMMVALYPDEKKSAFVVDLKKNTWWPSNAFIPPEEEWESDLKSLCEFYQDDSSFDHGELCSQVN